MAPAVTISEDQATIDAILSEVPDAEQVESYDELPEGPSSGTSELDLKPGWKCEAKDFYPNKEGMSI